MAPRAVLMKTSLKYVNTARPVNTVRSVNTGRSFSTAKSFNTVRPSSTAQPKSTIHYARPRTYFQNQAQSTVRRPFYKRTTLTKMSYNQNVNTGRQRFNTGRFNNVKPSACWVWRPIKPNGASLSNSQLNDKGFVDSGCSRHMTGNIAHLSYFKDFNRSYVTFGGGAYGGRITGKGTIKIDNLDFDDVYFVKELKFNLFSVSQMCDKKNYVLFTDSECLVLSPNFKLPDENQILLKIPRQDNMYSFDMKNIVPKDSLTCLVAKATSEESMLWHRRLGHINFKNINKLVKENLDETSEILKNFIKEVENLVDKKVKIIRSDNGTEFKNKVMDDFCREKRTGGGARGIKRGISVAWTPQQNGVANGELVGTSLRLLEQLVAGKIFYDFQVSKEFLFMKDKDELHDEDDATKVSSHDGSSLKENGTADQQEEPKRVSQALRDLAWVEAMQEELIQFKLQKVWILVDLPKGHRCNFYKVVSETMKDERGGALSSEKQARTCCSKDITKYTDRLLMTQSLYCGLDLRQSDVPSL
ncbi:ribonuclease H-like domain-containing protein [Tanacetum coccineum]